MSDGNHNHPGYNGRPLATAGGKFLDGDVGQSFTLETIAFLLLLTIMVRVVGDVINRVRNSRAMERSLEANMMLLEWSRDAAVKNDENLELLLSRRVIQALESLEAA